MRIKNFAIIVWGGVIIMPFLISSCDKDDEVIIDENNNIVLKKYKKVLFIGDSTTRGLIVSLDSVSDLEETSYPYFLNELVPFWNITNAGYSGATCQTWYETYFNYYNYSDYDLCFIELGYNGYLEGNIPNDVLPFINPENYKETDVGYYCRIIDKIKEKNKSIRIILVASSYFRHNFTYMRLLPIISHYSNLSFIDLTDSRFDDLSQNKYHNLVRDDEGTTFMDYIHFNENGYKAKASVVYYSLLSILERNYYHPDFNYNFSVNGAYFLNNTELVKVENNYYNTGKIPFSKGDRLTLYASTGSSIVPVFFCLNNKYEIIKWQLPTTMDLNRYELDATEDMEYIICCTSSDKVSSSVVNINRNGTDK